MNATKRRPAILAVLAAAMLLTSGTAGVALAATPAPTDAQTQDGDEVIEEFRETIDSLETVQFTQTSEMVYNNETTTTTMQVAADLEDGQKRIETLNTTSGSNTTQVWDDGTVVTYNADENTVSEYEVSGTSVLPQIQGLANESLIDYEYLGTETVDGEEAYVLEGVRDEQAQQNADAEASATIYIDTETYFPVKTVWETTAEEYNYSSTVSYENVTLNEELPASTFELDLPDDVEDLRNDDQPDISNYDSYDSLAADTDLSVPAADLGDGFSFDGGVVVEDDEFHSVTLRYTDGEESISVVTRAEPITSFDHSDSDRYEAVDVGDTTGYLYSSDDFLVLYVEADQPYTIYGEIGEDTAVELAESITDE